MVVAVLFFKNCKYLSLVQTFIGTRTFYLQRLNQFVLSLDSLPINVVNPLHVNVKYHEIYFSDYVNLPFLKKNYK